MKRTVDDLINLIKQYIESHDENLCYGEHDCLHELQNEIDNIYAEWCNDQLVAVSKIEASGESVINASGNVYIENGRKYQNKKVRWVILKDEGR